MADGRTPADNPDLILAPSADKAEFMERPPAREIAARLRADANALRQIPADAVMAEPSRLKAWQPIGPPVPNDINVRDRIARYIVRRNHDDPTTEAAKREWMDVTAFLDSVLPAAPPAVPPPAVKEK